MAISVNHFKVGTDRGVPVGSDAGGVDDDCAALTTVVVGGRLLGVLLLPLFRY
jgi:hypothetical protein